LKPAKLKKPDPVHIKRIFILLVFLVTSCAPKIQDVTPSITPTILEATPTFTPEPTKTPIPPTPTPTLINALCSPLENETVPELVEIITQPFKMPRQANDDGHHGVDFSFYSRKGRSGMEGLGVNAALPGTVVTILDDRLPYGYGVLIETPLELIDPTLLVNIPVLQPEPTVVPDPRVNCPPGELAFTLDDEKRSLYTFYGHFQAPVEFSVGDQVICGQQIGLIGNTGLSSNPHLHFETRIGPSGARFDSMAYYTLNSTQSERYNYCVWRVSNTFQLFDPMLLLSAQE
jgi:murein DD-endopeptidase MepM/ murein hydrolase activator NlpD